ncbi:hypothetical protein [Muricoccus radiodurans]|uniref:hypothetical protein n=1 Tax=Muricoccus radiodurans TaxID=2231721 RepID=UPI003CED653F
MIRWYEQSAPIRTRPVIACGLLLTMATALDGVTVSRPGRVDEPVAESRENWPSGLRTLGRPSAQHSTGRDGIAVRKLAARDAGWEECRA